MFSNGVRTISKVARKCIAGVSSSVTTSSSAASYPDNHSARSTLTSNSTRYMKNSPREPILIQSAESCRQFLDSYDNFLFDCDGVLWGKDHVTRISGITEAISLLHHLNKRLLYVTNNSIKSRCMLQNKFQEYGFNSNLENIYTNSYACALYLKEFLGVSDRVYLVGSEGMKWELDQMGIGNFGIGADVDTPTSDNTKLLRYECKDFVNCVLVGFDQHFSFNKMFKASTYLMNPSCHFIATNVVEKGVIIGQGDVKRRMPLTGVMVNAIAEAADRQPVVVGKPFATMFECILKQFTDIDLSRTVFVGDSLKADMGFAKSVGIDSALVLTGVNEARDITEFPNLIPEFVLSSLSDIVH